MPASNRRLEGALHNRQERELERHVACLELGNDVVQVTLAARKRTFHVIGMVHVPSHLHIDGQL